MRQRRQIPQGHQGNPGSAFVAVDYAALPIGRRLHQLFGFAFQPTPQAPDDCRTRSFVGGGVDLLCDIDEELGEVVVPVESRNFVGFKPTRLVDVDLLGRLGAKLISIVDERQDEPVVPQRR